jgi:hypothetical protein
MLQYLLLWMFGATVAAFKTTDPRLESYNPHMLIARLKKGHSPFCRHCTR